MYKKVFLLITSIVLFALPVYALIQRDFMLFYISSILFMFTVLASLSVTVVFYCIKKPKIGLFVVSVILLVPSLFFIFKNNINDYAGAYFLHQAISAEIESDSSARSQIDLTGYTVERFVNEFPGCCQVNRTRYEFGKFITSWITLDYLENYEVYYYFSIFGYERYGLPK